MDMSLKLASSYFDMLKSLSDEAKLHLIKMLTDSILKKEAKNRTGNGKLEDLFGVWADDPGRQQKAHEPPHPRDGGVDGGVGSVGQIGRAHV